MQTLRKRGGPVSKIFFGPSGLRLSKINGEGGGGGGDTGPLPWIRYCYYLFIFLGHITWQTLHKKTYHHPFA